MDWGALACGLWSRATSAVPGLEPCVAYWVRVVVVELEPVLLVLTVAGVAVLAHRLSGSAREVHACHACPPAPVLRLCSCVGLVQAS